MTSEQLKYLFNSLFDVIFGTNTATYNALGLTRLHDSSSTLTTDVWVIKIITLITCTWVHLAVVNRNGVSFGLSLIKLGLTHLAVPSHLRACKWPLILNRGLSFEIGWTICLKFNFIIFNIPSCSLDSYLAFSSDFAGSVFVELFSWLHLHFQFWILAAVIYWE